MTSRSAPRPIRSPKTRSARRSTRAACRIRSMTAAAPSTAPSSISTCTTRSGENGSSEPCRSISCCRNASSLKYRGSDGHDHPPVMIHRALAGSLERFFGVLIEHYGGAFPAWLAPVQAVVVPISEHQLDYARSVAARLQIEGFRTSSTRRTRSRLQNPPLEDAESSVHLCRRETRSRRRTVNANERGRDEKRTVSIDAFVEELDTSGRGKTIGTMKCDARAVFAALALVLASCQGGGLDSGMRRLASRFAAGSDERGRHERRHGRHERWDFRADSRCERPGRARPILARRLRPNEAQYSISQGPTGMKCPNVTLSYQRNTACTLAFNMPTPSPAPSGSANPTAKPTATPTPTPEPRRLRTTATTATTHRRRHRRHTA